MTPKQQAIAIGALVGGVPLVISIYIMPAGFLIWSFVAWLGGITLEFFFGGWALLCLYFTVKYFFF